MVHPRNIEGLKGGVVRKRRAFRRGQPNTIRSPHILGSSEESSRIEAGIFHSNYSVVVHCRNGVGIVCVG